ncbi:MAG TPA: DUF393 domain-containing protein [Pontiella sp.]
MNSSEQLLILFDGDCPICQRKIHFLKCRDKQHRLSFSDIRSASFLPPEDISLLQMEAQIYAIAPNGKILSGMEVIRAAHQQIGVGWLSAFTGWPILRPIFDFLYRLMAQNRRTISRFFKM